ncbi:putative glycosidase [Dioscorea sansibarensis]
MGKMGIGLLLFLFLYMLTGITSQDTENVTIIVDGFKTIAETDDNFVCATLDWWPPEKCNYNQCPWGQASILNLDLNHSTLTKAIKAFGSLRLRIGGSLQDQVDYGVGDLAQPCLPFKKMQGGLFGFSNGCLSMKRWDDLNFFFEKTGAIVTFGLNALKGRQHTKKGVWGGPWNYRNAFDFIQYTVSQGYPVESWEFGNELSGHGIGASVDAEQYGKDLNALKSILNELYNNSGLRSVILAPGGFFDQGWYTQLLQFSGDRIVSGMTHHIYNLGSGDDPHIASKILDPKYLDQIANTFINLQLTIETYGPWSSPWVGEAGGAYNSGSQQVSNKFLNSFWYMDQLGMASKYDTKVYCRQTLIGGNYGLLDTNTFMPNPDYYSALLWHRLMGIGVLLVHVRGSPYLRAYAHCSKDNTGITILLINLSNSTQFNVTVQNDVGVYKTGTLEESANQQEYHLTAENNNYLNQTIQLNGSPLELTGDGDIPSLEPIFVGDSPVLVGPSSITFVVLPDFDAPACS